MTRTFAQALTRDPNKTIAALAAELTELVGNAKALKLADLLRRELEKGE